MKNTKKALLLSVMSLVLCLSMLVGTTFAWFTDSVSTAKNTIASGNLDIELEYSKTMAQDSWNSVEGQSDLINPSAKWEPGHTEVVYLRISNLGSLALKYQFNMTVANSVIGKSVLGNDIKLAEYLKYDIVAVDAKFADRDAARNEIGEGKALATYTDAGSMKAGDAPKTYALVVYMPETVGNEANHVTGTAAPTIDLGLQLVATQLMAEEDSFNETYDKNAGYAVEVKTAEELAAALRHGGLIKVMADIDLAERIEVPKGSVSTLDMNGHKISTDGGNAIYSSGDLTIIGEGTISSVSNYAIRVQMGKLTIDSDKIEVVSDFGAISVFNGADVTINGGYFENKGYDNKTSHTIYLGGYGTININGGTFKSGYSNGGIDTICGYGWSNSANQKAVINLNGGTFYPSGLNGAYYFISNYDGGWTQININGGTYHKYDPSKIGGTKFAANHVATNNGDGTWTVERVYNTVTAPSTDKAENGAALADAINNTTTPYIQLGAGEYKMPSVSGSKEVTIVGDENTVIDMTMGAYLENAQVSFEGVTIKTGTGKVNGNGSDYAALYTKNATYTDCTFVGPMRLGRDGAKFVGCTFTELGNDYIWNYGNDVTFEGCTFNTEGKAILLYNDGGNEVANVVVKNCVFNATKGAKAGAIANQNCAAIEIQNYGNGVNLTTEGNTYDSDFSGEWRIKTYHEGRTAVIVNGTTYTSIAIDGKTMTIDADKNVTIN